MVLDPFIATSVGKDDHIIRSETVDGDCARIDHKGFVGIRAPNVECAFAADNGIDVAELEIDAFAVDGAEADIKRIIDA